jgi:methionyl-tRNA formyltransferase
MQTFRALAPDVGVVVGYGHILKPDLLAIPARGMVNVHPSLLPELRGAAPIEWAIINGLTHTGVSIMKMDSGMDSGPILHAIREELPPDITGGELSAHLSELGAEALVEALMLLEQEAVRPRAQDHARATYAPKLTRETAHIDWTLAAERVARLIRGLDPRPGAWSTLDGQAVKLFGAVADGGRGGVPGEVLQADSRLCIATQDGTVAVEEVQAEGKARMPVAEWVRGRGARVGARFQ